jgi:ABC-type lipoprotein release transport system permease subunit
MLKFLWKKVITSPLSVGKYFVRNNLKFIPLFLIISLSILALTVCIAIADSVILDKNEDLRFYEHFSVLTVKSDKLQDSEDYVKRLKEDGLIKDYLLSRIQYITTKTIADNVRRPVIGAKTEDLKKIKTHLNIDFDETDLNKDKKIILSDKVIKNKKLVYSDQINTKRGNYEEYMYRSYDFSGLIKFNDNSKYINMGFTTYNEDKKDEVSHILILNNPKKMDHLMIEFDKITENGDKNVMYYTYMKGKYDESTKSMLSLLMFVSTVVTIVEACCVSLLFFMYINSRNEEVGLLMLIGYSKGFVIMKLLIENFFLILFGWGFSWVLSYGTFEFINRILFAPLYVSQLTIFNPNVFTYSLYIPLVVIITTFLTIFYKVSRNDAISIIENK